MNNKAMHVKDFLSPKECEAEKKIASYEDGTYQTKIIRLCNRGNLLTALFNGIIYRTITSLLLIYLNKKWGLIYGNTQNKREIHFSQWMAHEKKTKTAVPKVVIG